MTMMNGRFQGTPGAAGTPGTQGVRSLGRVGLWGAPASGKTTFLAALNIAVSQAPMEDLMIYGVDDTSTDFLVENTAKLTSDRRFPDATQSGSQYSWVLRMATQVPEKKFMKTKMTTVPLELNLDLLDEPGRSFGDTPDLGTGTTSRPSGANLGFDDDDPADAVGGDFGAPVSEDDVMDQLASCDGLLLLFDPTREWREGDAYNYFQGTLLRIAQRRMAGGGPGGRLPQYVAVCVTKFDHPDVYRRAKVRGYRSFSMDDPALFPRVPDELAEKFFAELVREGKKGNAELIGSTLRKFFIPDRVKFFITSAIGFHKNPRSSRFQEADFMNIVPQESGAPPLIRGPIHPINVVEPLIWLGQNLSRPGNR